MNVSEFPSLDNIGDEDPNNYILSWADITDPGSHQQAMMIATILNNQDQYGNSDYEDTKTWKAHIPCHDLAKWLSHYLYFFSFSFSFLLLLDLQLQRWSMGKYHVTLSQCHNWCDGGSQMVMSQITVTECHMMRVT